MAYLDNNGVLYLWGKIKAHVSTAISGFYTKPSGGIPDSDIASAATWNAKGTYSKPSGGIPASDLAAGVIPDISGKANAADVYTKTEIDGKLTNAYVYKGSVATVSDLPSSGVEAGWVYNVEASGMNYAWNGSAWDALGETFSITAITNAEIDTICT